MIKDENMVVKVLAETYLSDPDVYISKTNDFPTSTANSEWHCKVEGSETCVVDKQFVKIGDIFNIGVKCSKKCGYKLKVQLQDTYTIQEAERTQMRWGDYTTQLMRFYVPADIKQIKVEYVDIIVKPENSYSRVQMFLSLDPSFSLL